MEESWIRFLKEGNDIYNYMVNNFKEMFEDETHIKHFEIREGIYLFFEDIEEIMNKYGKNIHNQLLYFIENEIKYNILFNKSNWKPFRKSDCPTEMYLGYKKLFKYNNYYFQLAIDKYCDIDNCYCYKYNNCNCFKSKINPHFILTFYASVDTIINKIKPYDDIIILENNIMSEREWNYK